MKIRYFFLCIFLLLSNVILAQRGIITGTLEGKDGMPIPGVSIVIKGTDNRIQTDFDGNYSISCEVGDTLIFSYIGFSTKEVKVTSIMFNGTVKTKMPKSVPVKHVISKDYINQLNQSKSPEFQIPDINNATKTYTLNKRYFDYSHIKTIEPDTDKVRVKMYPEDIYFEINVNQKSSLQFVPKKNLPSIQNLYAQGRPNNGNLNWSGAESNEIFSYGPRITNLEYSGQAYDYDVNGKLVNLGQGSGMLALPYRETIFKSGLNTFTSINLNVHSGEHKFNFNYKNSSLKNLFNTSGDKTNYADFSYINKGGPLHWDTSLQYNNSKNENANINGLHNQIYFSDLIKPASFSNNQGFVLNNGSQRSFSPQNFNNPIWLLKQNGNQFEYSFFKVLLKNKIYPMENLNIETGIAYSKQSENMHFGLPQGTNGFLESYRSQKSFDTEAIAVDLSVTYPDFYIVGDFYVHPYSSVSYTNTRLDYDFREEVGSQELNPILIQPEKSTVQLKNRLDFEAYFDFNLKLTLQNNSFNSSIQGNEWFLPSIKFYSNFSNLFNYSDFINSISISGGFSKDVVDFPLYYDNPSHNSLLIEPSNSLSYTANNDLFNASTLDFEKVEQFDIETKISLLNNRLVLAASYFNSVNKNSIFPFYEGTDWQLRNIAEIRNKGFETSLQFFINEYYNSGFRYDTRLVFTTNRPIVEKVYGENLNRIPIAGFQNISKNLIVGQPAGTLVGSAYLKNDIGQTVIGSDGFPLVDSQLRILGNPVPDYNLGWTNTISFKQFTLSFLLDYQKGGDIWNGTQNTLNYFGVSEETAQLRNTTDFIFQGVNEQGIVNSIPVDFAPATSSVTQNRWVRYGFEGVAEDAIEDGSYINLKSLSFTYKIKNKSKSTFFKEVDFGFFAKNIWSWSKTRGVNPYSSMFGNSSAKGLHFFNLPLVSEVGLNINLKI